MVMGQEIVVVKNNVDEGIIMDGHGHDHDWRGSRYFTAEAKLPPPPAPSIPPQLIHC